MAALAAVVSANTAWQKVRNALNDSKPATQEAFRALKTYLATQKLNPPLNVAFFTQADSIVAATGTALGSGAATVYAIYAKKGTLATVSYFQVFDSETGDLSGNRVLAFQMTGAGDEKFLIDPEGLLLTTGVGVHATTNWTGSTSIGASGAADGFVIYSV